MRNGVIAMFLPLAVWAASAEGQSPGQAEPPAFAVGQKWSVKADPPAAITLVVGRTETLPGLSDVVHISLFDVPIPRGLAGAGGTTIVAHLPMSEAALAASVDTLLATGVAPDPHFDEGYQGWRAANGGIFTAGVAETVDVVFRAMAGGGRRDNKKK